MAETAILRSELAQSGIKHTPENIVRVGRMPDGKIAFLEKGNSMSGLQHIETHAAEFAARGISREQIPDAVMEAVTKGKVIGYQGKGTERPVYEFVFQGNTQYLSVTVGDNGFVVGANPTRSALIEKLTQGR